MKVFNGNAGDQLNITGSVGDHTDLWRNCGKRKR